MSCHRFFLLLKTRLLNTCLCPIDLACCKSKWIKLFIGFSTVNNNKVGRRKLKVKLLPPKSYPFLHATIREL